MERTPILAEPDSLLEQLSGVNKRLQTISVEDAVELGKALELRAQLLSRAGRLLRTAVNPETLKAYRNTLEEAVETGDAAVRRLLSLRQAIRSKRQRLEWMRTDLPTTESEITCRM